MTIDFHYETDFQLDTEKRLKSWIIKIFELENSYCSNIDYVFCDDEYLLAINRRHLNHDTYTDIITFDYTIGDQISGDIFISVDRVRENSVKFSEDFKEEMLRVMSHGILHLLGFNDKTETEKKIMRAKENEMIKLFHVEQ